MRFLSPVSGQNGAGKWPPRGHVARRGGLVGSGTPRPVRLCGFHTRGRLPQCPNRLPERSPAQRAWRARTVRLTSSQDSPEAGFFSRFAPVPALANRGLARSPARPHGRPTDLRQVGASRRGLDRRLTLNPFGSPLPILSDCRAAWTYHHALPADVREADVALAPLHRLCLNAIGFVWSRHAWQSPPATAMQR